MEKTRKQGASYRAVIATTRLREIAFVHVT